MFIVFSITLGTIYVTVKLQSSSRREKFYLDVQYMKYVMNCILFFWEDIFIFRSMPPLGFDIEKH